MTIKKKLASLAIVGAVLATSFVGAQAAQADVISGGTITITPTSGNVNTDTVFLNSVATNVAAPAGYTAAAGTVVFQNGVNMGSVANVRTPAVTGYGDTGLTGSPMNMDRSISPTNQYVSNKLLNATNQPLATGPFELRVYFFANQQAPNYVTDKFISLAMTYNATTGAWALDVPAISTTTSLTASASGSTVTLAATVKKSSDSTTATAAAGNIVFKEGATTVATVPVASGAATATLNAVADGAHTYTAEFAPSNTAYAASTSGTASVQVGGITATSTVTTTVPSGVGTLTLTGVSSTVALGTASLSGGTLNAQGTLNAVVTDTRQTDYPVWNLTGQVGNFTDGAKVLDGKYLGWTPAVAAGSIGTAGAAVVAAPTSTDGLKAISQLATGAPSTAGTVTTASALLQLKAPSNTPAGSYSATLTLTLI